MKSQGRRRPLGWKSPGACGGPKGRRPPSSGTTSGPAGGRTRRRRRCAVRKTPGGAAPRRRRTAAASPAGWELSTKIGSPFHRAVFLGFVVSEVHPFTAGNGRATRMISDAHLLAAGFSGIVVTTRSRDLYLRALRCASRRDSSQGDWRAFLASTMERLHRTYRDLPVRSTEETLSFCKRENLES
ncbi:MAG: Fic family protein [Elusimicrobia bacterium]|nr:Fic family protein [Elusimicrobiota bacterium]